MDFVKYSIFVLVVLFVEGDAGGHEESHHDHVKLHVPEFVHHDHHTKVITIHHHHHKPKKEHHHHHHHHHQKPHIPYGPPKYHHTHHHSKSSSHSVSKGHTTHLGQKSLGQHGHHGHSGKHGHSGHQGHQSHKHHDAPTSYDPPSTNYDPPTVNYAPPSINYNHSPSLGSDYSALLPSVPNIPSPQVHGVVHTVQQVKVFDSLPGALKAGGTGYQVTEQGEEGEDDVFTSVNSLSQTYPGTYGFVRNAAAEHSDVFSDIAHSNTNQSPNTDPFAGAQPQTIYSNLEDFTIHSQSAQPQAHVQPSYAEVTGYDNVDNTKIGTGNGLSGGSVLSFAEAVEDDTPISFSREAGLQHAINTGGIETVAY